MKNKWTDPFAGYTATYLRLEPGTRFKDTSDRRKVHVVQDSWYSGSHGVQTVVTQHGTLTLTAQVDMIRLV